MVSKSALRADVNERDAPLIPREVFPAAERLGTLLEYEQHRCMWVLARESREGVHRAGGVAEQGE